jgi:threonine/homoserine/homoserine lactone efflux protein
MIQILVVIAAVYLCLVSVQFRKAVAIVAVAGALFVAFIASLPWNDRGSHQAPVVQAQPAPAVAAAPYPTGMSANRCDTLRHIYPQSMLPDGCGK